MKTQAIQWTRCHSEGRMSQVHLVDPDTLTDHYRFKSRFGFAGKMMHTAHAHRLVCGRDRNGRSVVLLAQRVAKASTNKCKRCFNPQPEK